MKALWALAASAALVGSCFSASALTYTFTDSDYYGTMLTVGGVPVSGDFNVRTGDGTGTPGFIPGTHTIISAVAAFTFLDENDVENEVSVTLNNDDFISNAAVGGDFEIQTSLNGVVSGTAYFVLNSTGIITYSVELVTGDPVVLVLASLKVKAGDAVQGVPDAGMTLGLLGFGLVSTGWVRRQLRAGRAS